MTTVDNRVVKMAFDNSNFERNAGKSIHTLDQLKKALNFDGATKGLSNIEEKTRSINMNALVEGVQNVSDKFNALGVIGFTVLQNLTNTAIDAGKRMASALTIDPIKMGFQEYETQINAVQTILANTEAKMKEQGLDDSQRLALVNEKLDELNRYADKTIYNFTEMTRNIGTFTAAGVDLETATNAIQGIANLAAVSGSNSQQASSAMYQLSQALASGTVKLMDWNSVVNAGMGGQVFQDQLKETARAHGIAIDDMISKQGSFRETLQEGWLTSEILTETLEKFTASTEGLTEAQIEEQRALWRTRGYTEEQIDAIFELGKMSTDAATKVKTFSQLIDTTKEALQSGWTQSWEYIIGDFEEAKELWTSISDVLNDYINKSAEARNSVLKDWSESEGGRKAVIEGLWNAFNALVSVLGTVKEAFSEVFPPITAETLIDLSTKFKDFTAGLALSDEALANLKNRAEYIFKALRSVVNGLGNIGSSIFNIFSGIAGAIKDVFFGEFSYIEPYISSIAKRFEEFTEAIKINGESVNDLKRFFTGIFTVLRSVASVVLDFAINAWDMLGNVLGKIVPNTKGFISVLGDVGDILTKVGDAIETAFSIEDVSIFEYIFGTMSEAISKFINAVKEYFRIEEVGEKLKSFIHSIASKDSEDSVTIIDHLANVFEKFKGALEQIAPIVKSVFESIKNTLSDAFGSVKPLDILGALGLGAGGVGVYKISKLFSKVDEVVEGAKGWKDNLKEIKDALVDTFGAIQTNLKADALKSIAVAIALLAASLFVISLINPEKLLGSIAALSILIYEVTAMLNNLSGITGKAKNMVGAASLLIGMAIAISVLAIALRIIGTMNVGDILKGLAAVTVMLFELTTVTAVLSETGGKITKGAGQLILMATALTLLAVPIKILGSMDTGSLIKGLGSVLALMVGIAAVSAISSMGQMGISAGIGMMAMAAALTVMIIPVKTFAAMDIGSLVKGLGSVAVLLTSLAIAARLMPKNMVSIGVGMTAMAAGIALMASAVKTLGGTDLWGLIKGLGALAVALGLLVVAAKLIQTAVPGAVAMSILAAAMVPLAISLKLLSSIPFEQLLVGLIGLAGAITIMGVAASVLSPIIPAMIALAGAMILFGTAAALFSAAFLMISVAVATGGVALIAFIQEAIALLPYFGQMIGEMIVSLAESVTNGMTSIGEAIKATIETILMVVGEEIPAIVDTLLSFLTQILESLADYVPQMAEAGLQIVLGFLQAVADNIQDIVEAGISIGVNFINGVSEKLGDVIDAAFKLIISFINGLADAIRNNHQDLFDAVKNLIDAIVEAILDLASDVVDAGGDLIGQFIDGFDGFWNDVWDAGANLVTGFVDGLLSGLNDVWNAACDLANQAWNAITGTLDEHSPSRLTYEGGKNFTQGFINGMGSLTGDVKDASSDIGTIAADSFDSALNSDYEPTITPVLDLSNIQNGIGSMDSMFSSIPPTYGIDGSIQSKVGLASDAMNALKIGNDYKVILNEMEALRDDLSKLTDTMANLRVVMDTGSLVGALTPGIDSALGTRQMFFGRGVI